MPLSLAYPLLNFMIGSKVVSFTADINYQGLFSLMAFPQANDLLAAKMEKSSALTLESRRVRDYTLERLGTREFKIGLGQNCSLPLKLKYL